MVKELDRSNRKIIASLIQDPRMNVKKIARQASLSRPTVMVRLKKLKKKGIINIITGLTLHNLDFFIAHLFFEIKGQKAAEEMIDRLSICPRILLFSKLMHKANFWALIFAENHRTLKCVIENIRYSIPEGSIIHVFYSESSSIHGDLLVKIFSEKNEVTSCGKTCLVCQDYSHCVACPSSTDYKGIL